jgi:hypothetical protein
MDETPCTFEPQAHRYALDGATPPWRGTAGELAARVGDDAAPRARRAGRVNATGKPPSFTFEPQAHRYTLDGTVLPSVTQVLQPLYDFAGIPEAVLENKRLLGGAVHLACELLDRDNLDEDSEDGRAALVPIAGYVAAYKRFLAQTEAQVVENETQLWHPLHLYAGTIDRRYRIDGLLWDVDLKTTVVISPVVGPQTAAYSAMLQAHGHPPPQRRAALQLLPSGDFRLVEFKDPQDFAVFVSMLTVHRFKERNLK